ncbi:MAG: DUF370 domain-containing protein [Veillonellaceae bacterium]|uniref:extracellular matrix regulator RemB n=1 Tax=Anaerovibrio lipolyticus TaxID=82374 RepID=UPI001F2AEB49|nr:extracellular matrix/biofilm biosynthesis regulator RemA family protein [Anaerovibrio lipolyticus]MCI7077995.1 DUF370 domain-containing protein [Veillonellaceae bacterium]MDY5053436.1 DUF370 domain-containing protein [Anaerovibrio sp.]MCF2601182.1 DUF370 domain-containing protein [Anaerovibrio lipolyticus]MCI7090932.1 DUF370 domain-containing protein [Veillonellaceae bacterium]MCI7235112.1 DUF370 domain-containing protein [Veillonellaceae bacterium]
MIPVFIGGNMSIDSNTLVGIVDYSYFAQGENKVLLEKLAQEKRLVNLAAESSPRALVITTDKAYISAIAPLTLKKRTDRMGKGIYEFYSVEES